MDLVLQEFHEAQYLFALSKNIVAFSAFMNFGSSEHEDWTKEKDGEYESNLNEKEAKDDVGEN